MMPSTTRIATGTVTLDANGGFSTTFEIPAGANLGSASFDVTVPSITDVGYNGFSHGFQIEEFRRPEFEVTARTESAGPYVSADPATVAVDANYYAGGPLADAPVRWRVTTSDAGYSPPGWDPFTFGVWTPWWYASDFAYADTSFAGSDVSICCGPTADPTDVEEWTATTDASGHHFLQIDFTDSEGARPDLPKTVSAEASVTDVNRQEWASTTSVLVHPAQLYVGLRDTSTFVRSGEPLDVDVVVTDIEGNAVAGRSVEVVAVRLESSYVNGEWTETELDPQTCTVVSAIDPTPCSFLTTTAGTYEVRSVVTDDAGGSNRTELTRWVTGPDASPDRSVSQESIQLIPADESVAVGTSAEVLVRSPVAGEGLATITHGSDLTTQRFTAADGTAVLTFPITEADVPSFHVSVEIVGSAPRTGDDGSELPDTPARPAFATGELDLPVSLASRTLTVTATPQTDVLEPGASTSLAVTVTGADGAPAAGSRVAVIVADEAVLAVGGYQLPDPLATFYGQLGSYLQGRFARGSIELADPTRLPATGSDDTAASATTAAEQAAGGALDSSAVPIAAADGDASRSSAGFDASGGAIASRTDFSPLAVFEPELTTAADGTVSVDVDLPDTLTRYRVMVVAAQGADRFGTAESNLTARLPLSVRPSAPRFANFGDQFELPVIVQNLSDAAIDADVVVQTALLDAGATPGRRVNVPANGRVEVRFPMSTTSAGTAAYRIAVAGGSYADSAEGSFPVYTPVTAEAFATYGVIDDGAIAQPVTPPTDVVPEYGGLEITTSSTALQGLTDAVLYLDEYRYDSSDALAARITAISSLRDVLSAFSAATLPSASAIETRVADDIASLTAMQNDDGGFPYWSRGSESIAYNSIEATEALVMAKAEGYAVPQTTLDFALSFLREIESHFPELASQEVRDSLTAYALRVRDLAGDPDPQRAERLWNERGEDLPFDAIGWIWPVIDDPALDTAIGRFVSNRAVDTAGAVTFTTGFDEDDASVVLASDRRTDAILLDALLEQEPQSDLVPKLVTGLLAARRDGRWGNVQENSFVLVAMKHYFDIAEANDPAFTARVWVGERSAGEESFQGRSTDRLQLTVPTSELIGTADDDIVIQKDGTGRLYYRLGLRYAPASGRLDALDRGFTVARTYEAVDDPADVSRDADGTWQVKPGARVRVRVTMVAESRRAHAALIDPLPAGLEIVNPDLATSADTPPDPSEGDSFVPYWRSTWFDHQNQRDDRAEAFATSLEAGTYDYSYVARATTPGTFVVPPARAEEIYAPETFGRSATDRMVIGA